VQRNLANQRLIPGVNLSLKLSGVGATGPKPGSEDASFYSEFAFSEKV